MKIIEKIASITLDFLLFILGVWVLAVIGLWFAMKYGKTVAGIVVCLIGFAPAIVKALIIIIRRRHK